MPSLPYSIDLNPQQQNELKEVLEGLGPLAEHAKALPYALQDRFMTAEWGKGDRVPAIVESMTKNIQWRSEWEVDELLNSTQKCQQAYHKAWPSGIYGVIPTGQILNVERLVEFDCTAIAALVEETSIDHILKLRAQYHEAIELAKQGYGPTADINSRHYKHVYVLDLGGLELSKHFNTQARGILQALCSRFAGLYPESLQKLYLVNAPWIFAKIWKMVSIWVDPATKAKVEVVESSKVIPTLEKAGVPREQLPKFLGGENDGRMVGEIVDEIIKFNAAQTATFKVPLPLRTMNSGCLTLQPSGTTATTLSEDDSLAQFLIDDNEPNNSPVPINPPVSCSSRDVADYLESRLARLALIPT